MPTARAQAAEQAVLRRRLVEMEGLRIIARREPDDLVGRKGMAAELKRFADGDGLEILHASASRRRIMAVLLKVITDAPS